MFIFAVIVFLLLVCVFAFMYGAGHSRDWEREDREQAAALKGDEK